MILNFPELIKPVRKDLTNSHLSGIQLVICPKSDNFTKGIGFCVFCKLLLSRVAPISAFFFIKIYFGWM